MWLKVLDLEKLTSIKSKCVNYELSSTTLKLNDEPIVKS